MGGFAHVASSDVADRWWWSLLVKLRRELSEAPDISFDVANSAAPLRIAYKALVSYLSPFGHIAHLNASEALPCGLQDDLLGLFHLHWSH